MEKECILDYCGRILDIPTPMWDVEFYDVSEWKFGYQQQETNPHL